jgi:hypothetical protein
MQFKANDGSMHKSQKQAYDASQAPAPTDQPKSIEDDPKAMQCVDELKQMGYTADDVAQAMGEDEQQPDTGAAATQAAPLAIPGV